MLKRLKRLGAEHDRHQGFRKGVGGVERAWLCGRRKGSVP